MKGRTGKLYKWCEDADRRRFQIQPPPRNYLRLYLRNTTTAAVVPYDTAGNDIYKVINLATSGFYNYFSYCI